MTTKLKRSPLPWPWVPLHAYRAGVRQPTHRGKKRADERLCRKGAVWGAWQDSDLNEELTVKPKTKGDRTIERSTICKGCGRRLFELAKAKDIPEYN